MKKFFATGLISLFFASFAIAQNYDVERVSKAIDDMSKNPKYPSEYAKKMASYKSQYSSKKNSKGFQSEFDAFAREALLANPLIKENKDWIFIRRLSNHRSKGMPANWAGNSSLVVRNKKFPSEIKDELYSIDLTNLDSAAPFYKPDDTVGITDVDVSWEGDRIMYSALNKKNKWQIYELDLKTKKRRLLSIEKYEDVDYNDSVYLQDGSIIFASTACYASVPCVAGKDPVANFYKMDPSSDDANVRDSTIRQISFDQENAWAPTVFNDGKVMFTRWEYTDNSHYFSRILMKMNPDGSGQMSHYGSTSYWPNSLFSCRPIPGDTNKFIAVVSGHHGVIRSGELHLFDVSKGVIEAEGRVHQYLGYGKKYVPQMLDNLVGAVKLHFLSPYPLSENYVIVSFQDRGKKENSFSLYLVDKFDNATLLYKEDGYDIMEPMPIAPREKPPLIADKVDTDMDFGYVFLNNVYEGPGLKGVEKGAVKKLRIFEYNYNYRNKGSHEKIGLESGWEVKRVHGTVDVEPDGSAMFKLPANRPYSIQPLDKDGKALALFRSWMTLLAGETQSCVGCHEPSNTAPVGATASAGRKPPQNVKEFLGKPRGFSFDREVQPILNHYCVECHNGSNADIPNFKKENTPWKGKNYSNAYLALHPYVRRPGPESNQNLLSPLEFHADTSELIQMLSKGHKGVNLDEDSKRLFYTWIDLNVPYHGTLTEAYGKAPENQEERRRFFLEKYANRTDYYYERDDKTYDQSKYIKFNKAKGKVLSHADLKEPKASGFPFKAKEGKTVSIDVGGGKKIEFIQIPSGKFVQGSNDSFYDEGPALVADIKKPFYMSKYEITNEIYAEFDKAHNSGYLDRHWKDHINQGYPANEPKMPVIRVSYNEAQAFCQWLSKKIKKKVSLPTETQWEWAARAGSDKTFWYGDKDADFSKLENFSDKQASNFAVKGVNPKPMPNPGPFYAYVPCDSRYDDGQLVGAEVGKYKPNGFGLYDMAGNVAEWTSNSYTETLGGKVVEDKAVARGGSWADRPSFAKTTLRRPYYKWQKVYNVGFRVIVE